ncbi:RagB/SusD family nutrient uptake outer membrane protein [uncultured Butyricimonas sp.]|uniref:RagB/SusD family nutrient uptake outer membrane protein n=1 Tax=uncultured Butyricimonas sp. TaxID=1268785 RepID=UPI0026DCAA36|nr:RagB/SusD family nutrient uptake outer membrane protein [uncultured Butyricimonas sp.]
MKNCRFIYCLGILLYLLCTSCHDFFKESSQDEIKPSSVEDLRAVMYKEAYPYNFSTGTFLMLLTDEVQCNGLSNDSYATVHQNGTPVFTFNPMMFDGNEVFPEDVNSWKANYERIMGCNVIIDYLSEISGTEQEKNALRGQALLLRGFYYLKLATIYCQPYNAPGVDPSTALGVPLVLTMELTDDFPRRASLEALYRQIEDDLLTAATLLEANYTPDNVWRVGHVAAYTLLSRLYLYMGRDEDMDNVIKYADLAIGIGPALTRLSILGSGKSIYDSDVSSEVVWIYGGNSFKEGTFFTTNVVWGYDAPWEVSADLLRLYDATNDLRYSIYYASPYGYVYGNKVGYNTQNGSDHGLRMAEVYLNRAEALIRRSLATGNDADRVLALDDLNTLRETRYATGTYVDQQITDANELLEFCLMERRLELSLEEGFRWFDIKRLGLPVTHTYIDSEGVEREYTLESYSPLYALPIPYDAIERNYRLEQNPR